MTIALRIVLRAMLIAFSALGVACGNASHEDDGCAVESISIAHLKSLCSGDHYRITKDYAVSGTVVATDWLGELYKSVVIVDDTAGIEIAIDSHSIAGWLPIYAKVKVLCNGLVLARVGGKVEIGAPPTGDFLIDNIDEETASRIIRIEGVDESFAPATKRIGELDVADISSLVRLDDLRIVDSEQGLAWCDIVKDEVVTTMRTATDADGNTIAIRTLSTCRYARQIMPTERFSAVGVVEYSASTYALRIVNKMIFY